MISFGLKFEMTEQELVEIVEELAAEELRNISREAASIARNEHSYTNRTGKLQRSTRALPITGSFMAGTLSGGIEASADYAGFVEDGTSRSRAHPFLKPAMAKTLSSKGYFDGKEYF